MGEILQINVLIADKHYPINIPAEEEEQVRLSAKRVNEAVKEKERAYGGISGKQDALAMVVLELSVELEFYKKTLENFRKKLQADLETIEKEVKEELQQAIEPE